MKLKRCLALVAVVSLVGGISSNTKGQEQSAADLDQKLTDLLKKVGFTGRIQEKLPQRLGRSVDSKKAELGKLVFFDRGLGLHRDNACAACHAPRNGFGDTQSIAIGVDNNSVVGPNRKGPRNQRRTPSVINTAFYPKLMWNGRFESLSNDPFDNSKGFKFPVPEDTATFPPNDGRFKHLLTAQGHIPFTELPEMAGFSGTAKTEITFSRFQGVSALKRSPTVGKLKLFNLQSRSEPGAPGDPDEPDFSQFADLHGAPLPPNDPITISRNFPIREFVLGEINRIQEYRLRFSSLFPEVSVGAPIQFWMIGEVLAEFQISLTFANAPIDRFARGEVSAMSSAQKRGAVVFFEKASCVQCHSVKGQSNEMFSDFQMHVAGVPQIAPVFGKDSGNVAFLDAQGKPSSRGNHDFGLADITGVDQVADRYKFRTSPLRNIVLQPAFFHNGSFTKLEDAVKYHLNPAAGAKLYDPKAAGVAADLRNNIGPFEPVLANLDEKFKTTVQLSDADFRDLISFLNEGLFDPLASPDKLIALIPEDVPSKVPLPKFE